jgi:hypothetical protein
MFIFFERKAGAHFKNTRDGGRYGTEWSGEGHFYMLEIDHSPSLKY